MSFYAVFWPILALIAAAAIGAALWRGSARLNFRDGLGAILVAAFIGVLGGLMWHVIPKENEQLIVYMLGQLSGFVSAVVALHYVQKADDAALDKARTENTGKALDAIAAAAGTAPSVEPPLNGNGRPTGAEGDPVHTTDEGPET